MATGASVACPAKVNLFLRIVAREDSGYHQIETMFQAIGLYDRVDVYRGGEGVALEVRRGEAGLGSGDMASSFGDDTAALGDITAELGEPENNTAVKAARAFFAATEIEPAATIVLTKAIPAGTGLGGGSSDAAGTLSALNTLHGEPLRRRELIELGGEIGSDVPFFCTGAPTALAWGRGDRLMGCSPPPVAPVVLVMPRARISTAAAYRQVSARLQLPAPSTQLRGTGSGDWETLAALQGNDFERAAFGSAPVLGEVREALGEAGAVVARMTGSGSALFGVFADGDRARRAAGLAGEMAGVAAALVVPTLTEMPEVGWTAAEM